MIDFPHCKINLGLQITKKRPDGYHELVSCFYPVEWQDVLEVVPADTFSFRSTGLSILGNEKHNLVVKAFQLMSASYPLPPVAMHLHKILPMGAGLGGGSSDGAFTLKLLNKLFELNLPLSTLEDLAASLGSDCPFFVTNGPQMVTGRGEVLTSFSEFSLKGKHLVLVFPGLSISSGEAYRNVRPQVPSYALDRALQQPIASWKDLVRNDFETPLFQQYPLLAAIKKQLYQQGAQYASLTGSGSALYGIFSEQPKVSFPEDYTIWQGVLT